MIDKNDPRLTSFVLGELESQELTEIQAAIESSDELRQAVEEIRAVTGLMESHFAAESPTGLSIIQRQALEAAAGERTKTSVRANSSTESSVESSGLRRIAVLAIAAGLIGVLGTLGWPWIQENLNVPTVVKNNPELGGGMDLIGELDFDEDKERSELLDREQGEFEVNPNIKLPVLDKSIDAVTDEVSNVRSDLKRVSGGETNSSGHDDEGGDYGGQFGLDGDRDIVQDESWRERGKQRGEEENNEALLAGSVVSDQLEFSESEIWEAKKARRAKFAETRLSGESGQGQQGQQGRGQQGQGQQGRGQQGQGQQGQGQQGQGQQGQGQQGRGQQGQGQQGQGQQGQGQQGQGQQGQGQQGQGQQGEKENQLTRKQGSFEPQSDLDLQFRPGDFASKIPQRGGFDSNGQGQAPGEGKRELPLTNPVVRGPLFRFEEQGGEVASGKSVFFETRARTVSVNRTRTESRTRSVPVSKIGPDGIPYTEQKEQLYTVQVPYTENVTQTYTVPVPQLQLREFTFDGRGFTKQTDDSFLENLFRDIDGKNEVTGNGVTAHALSAQGADAIAVELRRRIDPAGVNEIMIATVGKDFQVLQKTETGTIPLPAEEQAEVDELLNFLWNHAGVEEEKRDNRLIAQQVQRALNHPRTKEKAKPKPRTWKRVKAVPNTTRLMVGDKDELDMNGMQVNVQVDGFRARVLIDCFYYNDRDQQLEGKFKLRLPDDASLYYFAFGQSVHKYDAKGKLARDEFMADDGAQYVSFRPNEIRRQRQDDWQNVKESRMVPREKAAYAYNQTVRRKIDPALVEWSGAGVFNASVFPLVPRQMHRIVIGYDVNLTETKEGWEYKLELPEQTGQCQVDVNVREIDGAEYSVFPNPDEQNTKQVAVKQSAFDQAKAKLAKARAEQGEDHLKIRKLQAQLQMMEMMRKMVNKGVDPKNGMALHSRSYRFNNPIPGEAIRIVAKGAKTTLLRSKDEHEGNFFAMRVTPEISAENSIGNRKAIFLIDTSLSSRPDKFNVWLQMLEGTLEHNRDSLKQFGVVFFNVDNRFWRNEYVENTPGNVEQLMNDCNSLSLEGATNLYGAMDRVAKSEWVGKNVDLFLLSDGAANWGETNLQLIRSVVTDNSLGNVFAYQTGMTGTAIAKLRFLTTETGGAVFSVAEEAEIAKASTAHRSRPWQLDRITVDGGSDIMTAGRVQSVYPGQAITIVGRHSGGNVGNVVLHLSQGETRKEISISPTAEVETDLASRMFGQVAVGQLENIGQAVFDVSAAYARHFRITGETCSLLMLETEADYQRFNIKPEEDLFVIKSKQATKLIEATLKARAAEIADPKAQLVSWLKRLEKMEGLTFEMPTALKLALDDLTVSAIAKPLACEFQSSDQLEKEFIVQLDSNKLDYKTVVDESNRRASTSSDDAIKVLSNLIEQNPGDLVLARDIAFAAMELGHPAQAYHLLRQVAMARPYEPSIYAALGLCLSQLGEADMAILFYEVAIAGNFQDRSNDYRQIVGTEYVHLLRKIEKGDLKSTAPDFAKARLHTLTEKLGISTADLVITMMWNIDQTDVDLHVVEPSGDECSYQNPRTRSGGQITRDIRGGFGPEMYTLKKAPRGKYEVLVKYFSTNTNRTGLRGKVYLTVYQNYGTPDEQTHRRTINVDNVGEKQSVITVGVGK